jgi:MoCo/4Fe-4S cofactor protein with predicted Tat translocation signal
VSKSYWRSLGQLSDSPEFRSNLEREFPEGASELPEGITRREMIALLGASLSFAGLAGCRRPEEHIVPFVNAPEEIVPGVPRRYATTLTFGRSALGVVVESHEGRPTKIEGNELHPGTSGRSNVRMQASILDLYDPDRAQSVRHAEAPSTWGDLVTAWGALETAHLADGGASLALLTGSFSSPTRARLLASFRARFPRARTVAYEPVSDENVLQGVRAATGRDLVPVLHLDAARVILSLDADLLGTDPDNVRNIAGFAAGRRAVVEGAPMNRLWAVEAATTLTGAMADHRIPLSPRLVPSLLAALASRLGVAGGSPSALPVVPGPWLDALAKDLKDNRGAGLIVAGPEHPPAVHAAVLALNAALGNVGRTLSLHEPVDAALPSRAALAELTGAMKAGEVKTLVLLGVNPVYDAPAELDFGAALAKVETSIALSTHADETVRRAVWHVPLAHPLESWEDARDPQGTISVVQPLILPLFGGKSATELLALVGTGKDQGGRDLVRETWKPILGEADFERRFNRVLHDGLLAGSARPAVTPEVSAQRLAELTRANVSNPPADVGIEVVFRPSAHLHDGRFANNGWLQELPDPITKLTWDNPALMSPATAERMGVGNEDLVRVSVGERSATLPAWIVPGQSDGTVVLTLGYGRSGVGRVADGAGCDVYPLRTSAASGWAGGASVVKAAGSSRQAPTQEHGSMEGRPLIREGTVEEYRRDPGFQKEASEVPELRSMWPERAYDSGHQWGMTIDLNACVGCNACVIACQSENNVPVVGKDQVRRGRQMHWIRVDRYFAGTPARPELVFQPVPCMQCENAPCEQVCPVAATVHDDEGLNVMVYNRCIGTRYCSNNCPYKVRRFNFFNFTKDTPEIVRLAQNPDVTVRSRGVMEKCTYCVQRINAAKLDARLASHELKDGDVKTACQQSCPASAIEFGDLRDAGSRVSKAKQDPRNYALLAELNTKPRTTYLAKVRNPHPDLGAS